MKIKAEFYNFSELLNFFDRLSSRVFAGKKMVELLLTNLFHDERCCI